MAAIQLLFNWASFQFSLLIKLELYFLINFELQFLIKFEPYFLTKLKL
jgi:hypothetical protein